MSAIAPVLETRAADPVQEAVVRLRRPSALAPALRAAGAALRAARIVSTHYKPFARARLLVETEEECGARDWLFVELYADAARAQQARAEGGAALALDGWDGLAWRLAHAPRLAHAAFCLDDQAFARFARAHALELPAGASPQLVRYVAKRRALFRCGSSPRALYIKCYRRGHDADAARNARLVDGAVPGVATPPVVAHDASLAAVVAREIAGERLTAHAGDAAACARTGAALARLHASALAPPARWTAAQELAALRQAMADMTRAAPELADPLARLADELAARAERLQLPDDAPIHGNLFGDQILVTPDAVGIVDWDDLARGDPLYDLGRLAAHLLYLRLTGAVTHAHVPALCAGYGAPDTARLRWHIALALPLRAKISALRPLAPRWRAQLACAVRAAAAILDGAELR